ncbi:MAG: DUF1294 domain-containing protein [Phycisphaerales bacterium]
MTLATTNATLWLAIAGAYVLMSVVTCGAFIIDKHRAQRDRWRIKERTLMLLALAFGWPGAMLGMKLARHKTRKRLFTLGVPAIAVLHALALAGLAWLSFFR